MTKETRARIVDKSKIVIPEGTMEDFKRPDHPDFWDSKELAANRWSGFRHNSLTNHAELWVDGVLKASISPEAVRLDPLAMNKAYEEIFCLPHVLPDTPECREWGAHLASIVEEISFTAAKAETTLVEEPAVKEGDYDA